MKFRKQPLQTVRKIPRVLRREMENTNLPEKLRVIVCDLFAEWYKHGYCMVNQKRAEYWVNSGKRKTMTDFFSHLERVGVLRRIGKSAKNARSIPREFIIEGFYSKKAAFSLTNSSARGSASECREWRTVVFSKEILEKQDDAWKEWCLLTDNKLLFDARGLTEWSKAVQNGISSLSLPTNVSCVDTKGMSLEKVDWLEQYVSKLGEGLSPVVAWKRNRLFHAMSGCPRKLRELGVFNYDGVSERGVTVDIHAMYWCILVSMLPDCDEKTRLIRLLGARGFYSKLADDTGSVNDGEFKKQVNMQCLFYKSHWPADCRPVWLAMQESFPELCSLILSLRHKHSVGGLSDLLMAVESKIVALGALLEASRLCPCIPLHDCLFVPESKAEQVRGIIVKHAAKVLGFEPQVRIA